MLYFFSTLKKIKVKNNFNRFEFIWQKVKDLELLLP